MIDHRGAAMVGVFRALHRKLKGPTVEIIFVIVIPRLLLVRWTFYWMFRLLLNYIRFKRIPIFFFLDSGLRKRRVEERGGKGGGGEGRVEEKGKGNIYRENVVFLDLFIVHAVFSRDTLAILSFGKTYCASHANSTRRTRVILFLIEKPLHDNFLSPGQSSTDFFFFFFFFHVFLRLKPFDTRTFSNSSIIFFIERRKKKNDFLDTLALWNDIIVHRENYSRWIIYL